MKKKIFTVLIFIVFFGGIAGAVIFKDIDQRISVIFVGGVFFFVGLLTAFEQKLTPRNAPILIFCIIGAITAGIPLWLVLAEKYPHSIPQYTDEMTNELVGGVCIIVGICISVFPILPELYNRRVCTEPVTATCVLVKSYLSSGKNGTRRVYSPVWEFDFYGKTYTVDENNYSSDKFEIGDVCEIFCNPFDPEEIYRKVKGTILSVLVFGLVFIGFGILIICI